MVCASGTLMALTGARICTVVVAVIPEISSVTVTITSPSALLVRTPSSVMLTFADACDGISAVQWSMVSALAGSHVQRMAVSEVIVPHASESASEVKGS